MDGCENASAIAKHMQAIFLYSSCMPNLPVNIHLMASECLQQMVNQSKCICQLANRNLAFHFVVLRNYFVFSSFFSPHLANRDASEFIFCKNQVLRPNHFAQFVYMKITDWLN